ncbi:MAG: histidine phosphatase family protein [Rhodocyclaceae bacterium]|nr:histidine phosphatase family protein [Rhodocyclaceae bacterium]
MNLILWRHAEAEDIAPDHSDAGRHLTERGRKQAQKMGAWLADQLPADAHIVASPAVRTRQTADALGRAYDIDARLFTDAGVEDYLAAADWNDKDQTRVLIAHQPTLGLLAALLMSGRPLPWSIKKGAIWWLAFESHDMPARLVCAFDSKHL